MLRCSVTCCVVFCCVVLCCVVLFRMSTQDAETFDYRGSYLSARANKFLKKGRVYMFDFMIKNQGDAHFGVGLADNGWDCRINCYPKHPFSHHGEGYMYYDNGEVSTIGNILYPPPFLLFFSVVTLYKQILINLHYA